MPTAGTPADEEFVTARPGHSNGPGITLTADQVATTRPAELAAAGYERVRIDGPVPAGEDVDEDLQLIRFLREATSHALRLDWVLGGLPLVELRNLTHLVPPTSGVNPSVDEYAASWRAAFRYGTYYYRRGPGFVLAKDVRPGGPAAHMTIDGISAAQFVALAEASVVSQLDPEARDALDDAVSFGLALSGSRHFTVLPFHMRHWPVPVLAV
jgi:hypothetical protein